MRRFLWCPLLLLLAFAPISAGNCGPLLNELMADPAADWDGDGAYSYRNDEWVEIINPGPGSLDLDGYFLADETGAPVYGFAGSLGPGEVRVVYGSESVTWESAHGEPATGLRLGNDGDTVQLRQSIAGDSLLIDAYTYATHEAEDDRSSGRLPDGTSSWVLFDALNPYGGSSLPLGTGLPPTPGQLNEGGGGDPSPPDETSWGRIKAIYSVR